MVTLKFRRDDALNQAKNDPGAITNLSALPSSAEKKHMENGKTKATHDSDLSKELGLKSWDAKRVQAFLICYHCGKRRCIYSAW